MNAMIWTPPARADLDGWAEAGNPGWSWNDLEPSLRRAEWPSATPRPRGHVGISVGPLRAVNPVTRALQDHVVCGVMHHCREPVTLAGSERLGNALDHLGASPRAHGHDRRAGSGADTLKQTSCPGESPFTLAPPCFADSFSKRRERQ